MKLHGANEEKVTLVFRFYEMVSPVAVAVFVTDAGCRSSADIQSTHLVRAEVIANRNRTIARQLRHAYIIQTVLSESF